MTKKLFPGLFSAIAEGIPALVGIIKPLIKKKKISDEELSVKSPEELISIVKDTQDKDDEKWYIWIIKRSVTLATIWFVIYLSKQMGVTYDDIMGLFGIIK